MGPSRLSGQGQSRPQLAALVETLLATSLFPSSGMCQQHAASNVSLIENSSAR